MSRIIWACDPGANGAFIRLSTTLSDYTVFPIKYGYQDALMLMQIDARNQATSGVIENLSMRLGDLKKAKAIAEMLKNAGRALLCFELAGIGYEEVDPKTWQYDFGLVGYSYEERKKLAVKIARSYFGDATKADADAKLIALHKYWKLNGIAPPRQKPELIKPLTIIREVYKP